MKVEWRINHEDVKKVMEFYDAAIFVSFDKKSSAGAS